MKVVGLITEYNPFHKGHQIHIEKSKEITGADFVVVVMSGNFVQRGEPAIVDKWTRARTALTCGADIVIEIPVHYATSSAEFFSTASVSLLKATGIVDAICFGSEIGMIKPLETIASILIDEPFDFKKSLETHLKAGLNFPKARALALMSTTNKTIADVIQTPNNILGIEYIKALKRLNSTIVPYTIKRTGASYHDQNPDAVIASATAIRKYLREDMKSNDLSLMLPNASYEYLSRAIESRTSPIYFNDYFPFLKYKLLTTPPQNLAKILDVTEGLEHRILSSITAATSMDQLLSVISTKRYTKTKLNRALLHILLEIEQETLQTFNINGYAQYIKVLGFKQSSQILMKQLKNHCQIPTIVNVKDSKKSLTSLQTKMLEDEIKATNLYNTIVLNKYGNSLKNDYTQPILMLKD